MCGVKRGGLFPSAEALNGPLLYRSLNLDLFCGTFSKRGAALVNMAALQKGKLKSNE